MTSTLVFDLREVKAEARRILPRDSPALVLIEGAPDVLAGPGAAERLAMIARFVWRSRQR